MKTAEQIAEELSVYSRRANVGAVDLKEAIFVALTAYAEERERVRINLGFLVPSKELEIYGCKVGANSRADALEEAARKQPCNPVSDMNTTMGW